MAKKKYFVAMHFHHMSDIKVLDPYGREHPLKVDGGMIGFLPIYASIEQLEAEYPELADNEAGITMFEIDEED